MARSRGVSAMAAGTAAALLALCVLLAAAERPSPPRLLPLAVLQANAARQQQQQSAANAEQSSNKQTEAALVPTEAAAAESSSSYPLSDQSTVPWSNLTSACQRCPAGSFSDMQNRSSLCFRRDVGGYCGALPGTCPFSQTLHTFENTLCTQCALGNYSSGAGNTECSRCPYGSEPSPDATTCNTCPPGSGTNETEAFCVVCEWGMYSNATTNMTCQRCPPAWISVSNKTGCAPCPIMKNSTDGMTCEYCSLSMDCWDPTEANCLKSCMPGQRQISGDGTYCAGCRACDPGTYSSKAMATFCNNCTAGTSQPLFGQTHCMPCAAGTYQPLVAQAECKTCEAGFYCNATSRFPCPNGKYCPAGSASPVTCSTFYEASSSGCKPTWQFITLVAGVSAAGVLILGFIARWIYKSRSPKSGYVPITATTTPVYTGL
eukprot:m.81870 g.81870  ORF g.81870 m.81870 type:complete len:432 (+) comp14888_c1_seq1:58-1353(+)